MTGLLRHGKAWRARNGCEQAIEREIAGVLEQMRRRCPAFIPSAQEMADIRLVARQWWHAKSHGR